MNPPRRPRRLHDGIDLEIGVVSVVQHHRVVRLRLDAQVTRDQRLEQEAEQAQVAAASAGSGQEERR